MIGPALVKLADWYAARRRRQIERASREAARLQEQTLLRLVRTARDTEFGQRDPLRLAITGRVRHYVNAFGENVIVEEIERALVGACRRTEADVAEFTVAPRYPSADEPRGGHEWLIEFRVPPLEREEFVRVLDETLQTLNADYRTQRKGSVGMLPPRVTPLAPGAFHRWMRRAGKLGDQHKVPRATNDRTLADALAPEIVCGGAAEATEATVGSR